MLLSSLALAAAPLPPPAPITERSVVVAPLHAYGDSVIWFAEEGRPVQVAVAALLANEGWAPVPLAELDAAMDRLDAGQIPDREGTCSPLPPAHSYFARRYEGAAVASVNLHCRAEPPAWDRGPFEPGCTLRVIVSRGSSRDELGRWEARLPLGIDPAGAEAAVASLVKVPPPERGYGGGVLGMAGGAQRPVRVVNLDAVGPWKDGDLGGLEAALTAEHTTLVACAADPTPRFDHWANPMQIEVDRDGAVTRCERQLRDHHADTSQACECGVVREKVGFSPGKEGRRARFDLQVDPLSAPPRPRETDNVRVELAVRTSTDPMVWSADGGGAVASERLNACLAAAGRLPTQDWPVSFALGPDGRPTGTWVSLPLDGGAEPLRGCLADALAEARFSCPFTGSSAIEASLRLSRSPFGAQDLHATTAAGITSLGVSVPSARWLYEPGLPEAGLVVIGADGAPRELVEGRVPAELHVAADARASLDGLLRVLRARGPALRRVFLVLRSDNQWVRMRFLVNVPAKGATRVSVLARPIEGQPTPKAEAARFVSTDGATVADLVRAAEAAGGRTRFLEL